MLPEPDFELHETPLEDDGAHPVRAISWRVIALGALTLAVTLALVAAVVPRLADQRAATVLHPTPTRADGSSVGITIVGSSGLPPGWHYVMPSGTHAIAHARNDPNVYDACGTTDGSSIFFRALQTGSTLWLSPRIIGPGNDCILSIDPQQPLNVALMTEAVGATLAFQCYRSFDGGATWRHESLPDGATFSGGMLWVNDAFFITRDVGSFTDGTPPNTHLLARSIAGGPFTWVDGSAGFGGIRAIIIGIDGAVRGALYLTLTRGASAGVFDRVQVISRDNGQTWQPITFAVNEQTLTQVGSPAGSDTLLGIAPHAIYRSLDGGTTWAAFPPFPSGVTNTPYTTYLTPDGTLVTQFMNSAQAGAGYQNYRAQVGDTAWQLLAPQTRDFPLMGVDWDAKGRLTTLYGGGGPNNALASYGV